MNLHFSACASRSEKSLTPQHVTGPGLGESVLWFVGVQLCHIVGLILTAVLLAGILHSAGMDWGSLEMLEFLAEQQLTLLSGEQFLFIMFAISAGTWRLRGNLGQRLGSRPLAFSHFYLITCLIMPLATTCSLIHLYGMNLWTACLEHFPALNFVAIPQSMDLLYKLQTDSSLWVLLLLFAAAPALAEEILFRGIIGRGLIARWGVLSGILATSILFGLAHGHPVHALAVIPMGIALHYVYWVTKSFWAPLYLHFGNNALAVWLSRQGAETAEAAMLSGSAMLLLGLSLALFLSFLWHTRAHFELTTQEQPKIWHHWEVPAGAVCQLRYATLPWRISLGGLVPLFGFLAIYWHG